MKIETPQHLTTKRDLALWWAANGFSVFPLKPGSKEPAIDEWPENATRDRAKVRLWWTLNPEYNIGVTTLKFGDSSDGLVCVDVDVKGDIDGRETAKKLEAEGVLSSSAVTQATPSGGTHFLYRLPAHVRPRFREFGPGIDILTGRRYFVGAGSTIQGKTYTLRSGDLLYVSEGFAEKCSRSIDESTPVQDPAPGVQINETRAEERAIEFLKTKAPQGVGQGARNTTCYELAARLKDLGVPESRATFLLKENWDVNNKPPMNGELEKTVRNAYNYTKNPVGIDAPEKQFPKIEEPEEPVQGDPIDEVNKDYFLVTASGRVHIVHEYIDQWGNPNLQRLTVQDFHTKLAPRRMVIQKEGKIKEVAVSQQWLLSPKRREYKGVVFKPGLEAHEDWYNTWTGFSFTPKAGGHYALDMFLEHAQENICGGDKQLFRWLIGYFAHLIQKPWEKPRTGLVFQGKEGVGKNAIVDRVGALISKYYLVTSRKSTLVGGFNAVLENKLLVVLNEVTWGGEKEADGILKNLTDGGQKHLIEPKYFDAYEAENLLRPVIIGNEPWLVSASAEARRYAVFSVGDGRLQDIEFFEKMRVGMEEGGYEHLLYYLLNFDLSGININKAPDTKGLAEQKELSLSPVAQWLYDCLATASIAEADFSGWPTQVKTDTLFDVFARYRIKTGIKSGRFSKVKFNKELKKYFPVEVSRYRVEGGREYFYKIPEIEKAREFWDQHFKVKTEWPSLDITDDFS